MTEFLVRGRGEASVHEMKVLQDGPPPGGFPSVRFGRRIPSGGPTGTAIFGVSALVIAYGFYKVRCRGWSWHTAARRARGSRLSQPGSSWLAPRATCRAPSREGGEAVA